MTEDIFPSQSEADIRRYVSDRVNGFIDWASARIKFSDKVLTKSEIQTTIALDLRNTVQRFEEQELKTWTSDYATELEHKGKLWIDAKEDLENFRREHKLTEPPRNKTPSQQLYHLTFMVFLVLFEAICNGGLLATGLSGGLVQGGAFAFLLALVNIVACFAIFGFFGAHFLRCHEGRWRLWGGLMLIAWLIFELHFSFGVAHYREALHAFADGNFENTIEPARQAIENLYTPLGDFWSWVLCGITFFFGTSAFVEGTFWREPVLNYTRKFNLEKITREEYNACYEEALEDLNEIKNKTIDKIKDAITKIETDFSTFSVAIQDKASDELKFKCSFEASRIAYQSLIKIYQSTNIRLRTADLKKAIPEYFRQDVDCVNDPIWARPMPNFDSDLDKKKLYEQFQLKAQVADELEVLIGRVHKASADAINPYKLKSF